MARDSVELELLVQRIQKQLAPKSEVLHNYKMMGRNSKTERQIDVLVRERIGQYEINIIIDCKDYRKAVDVKGVEEFIGLVNDVGAHKGVLVCPGGFTKAAKAVAERLQIDLYTPIDTDPHKWQASPFMPAPCDFRVASIAFGISTTAPVPFRILPDFFSMNVFYDQPGTELGTCYSKIVDRWNGGDFYENIGSIGHVSIFGDQVALTDNGYGTLCEMEATADILVSQQLRVGKISIAKMSGFRDGLSGRIITNAFTTGILDPNEIIDSWEIVEDEEALESLPAIRLTGLIAWDEHAQVEIAL